jgi:hypothetical protein
MERKVTKPKKELIELRAACKLAEEAFNRLRFTSQEWTADHARAYAAVMKANRLP